MKGKKQNVGYANDIRPLFRRKDINAMRQSFDLSSYEDVKDNIKVISEYLFSGSMPCDGPWPSEDLRLFKEWMDGDMQP